MRSGDISIMNIKTVVIWDVIQCVNTKVLEETFTFSIHGRGTYLPQKFCYGKEREVLYQGDRLDAVLTFINTSYMYKITRQFIFQRNITSLPTPKCYSAHI